MELDELISALCDIRHKIGNCPVLMTTIRENHLYNQCDLVVMTGQTGDVVRMEALGDNTLPLEDYEEFNEDKEED